MIMVLNQKGEIMISRQYRDDVSRVAADSFRIQVRQHRNTGLFNGCAYQWCMHCALLSPILLICSHYMCSVPAHDMNGPRRRARRVTVSFFVNNIIYAQFILCAHLALDSPLSPFTSTSLQVIAAKEASSQPPIKRIENCSFLYTRHLNMYFVALTKSNVNPALVFEYLFQKIRVLKAYLGEEFDESSMRNNMTLIYELMDETMDFGYPQNCAVDVLRLYINLGNVKPQDEPEPEQLTKQITGAIDWRREGIRYKKNEVYIDVLESVNLLISSTGSILRSEVTGRVQMNTKLTGMPECKFGLNDKLVIEKETAGNRKKPGVEIDDCTFHRCVRLGKFDADRTITFIPPDGEFELMRYRVNDNVNLPFRLIPAVQEEGQTK